MPDHHHITKYYSDRPSGSGESPWKSRESCVIHRSLTHWEALKTVAPDSRIGEDEVRHANAYTYGTGAEGSEKGPRKGPRTEGD